jgi:hypothetical protein
VIARRAVWTDPAVAKLVSKFVPAADEVGHLQRAKDPEALLFQQIAEHGHYGGRTVPTDTRQGIYALTPGGVFLASINHNAPDRVAAMLTTALARWDELTQKERLGDALPETSAAQASRIERRFPDGGLVLRVATRDLPRDAAACTDWRAAAWNTDTAWFWKEEVPGFVPADAKPGATRDVAGPLVRRIATCHLLDSVRGQAPAFDARDVETAKLTSTVTAVEGDTVTLKFVGAVRIVARGKWRTRGLDDVPPTDQTRGFDATLLGSATWDAKDARFTAFELVAAGPRWGATQYNGRADDLGPAPMGVVMTLAADDDRVAPACFWSYVR